MSEKAQSYREKTLALEATVRELNRQQLKLTSDLNEATGQCSALSSALEDQKSRTSLIGRECETYKEKYKICGNLEAVRTTVADMQAKLDDRKDQ